jgi:hypothetical protein
MKGGFSRKRKLGKALSGGLLGQLLGESGNTISNADRARLQAMMGSAGVGAGAAAALGETGKSISNADMARIQKLLGSMKSPQPKTDRQLMQFEDGGKVKKPKKLPKPKPKIGDRNEMGPIYTDTKTGKKVKRLNKGGGLNAAIDRVKKTQGMKKGGAAFPDLTGDGKVTKKDILKGRGVKGFEEGGSTISDADLEKLRKNLPFVPGKSGISDADLKKLRKNLPVRGKSGKNISNADLEKLMKPTNFKDGGEVRGMGRAYMGASRKAKIR